MDTPLLTAGVQWNVNTGLFFEYRPQYEQGSRNSTTKTKGVVMKETKSDSDNVLY